MENWVVVNKKADFNALAQKFGVSPVTARLIRNREIQTEEAFERYLSGNLSHLNDPHLLKDVDRLCAILEEKIEFQKTIQIIGDYDIDGVMATYILYRGISRVGGNVTTQIPNRMTDGYGVNEHLIELANKQGIDTIITCDNGIAAIEEIAYAKKLGMTVLVTDHHEIPYEETEGEKCYLRSEADAIVNPKQAECVYPFKGLCGAAVAWKVVQVLYELQGIPVEESYELLENVAFATVGDVMDLTDENRILVKEGLKRIRKTKNPGMRALILQNNLEIENVSAYHIGFVLGPCINASGRLDTARISLQLFMEQDLQKAAAIARELVELNMQRKDMTIESVELAREIVEKECKDDKVLVIYLPDTHESLAGIIAGRVREMYHKPVFVLTKAEEGMKGSGRSIEEYSMYEELCKCRELLTKFGGHPMAGSHNSGFKYSRANLFVGAPMVLVPPTFDDIRLLDRAKTLLAPAGFGRISVTTAADHDRMIAFTSQLAHVVSNAYIQSPTAGSHKGFSAGSYKDMTRVAWLDADMWTELFLENSDCLLSELDTLISCLQDYRNSIAAGDAEALRCRLNYGKHRKEEVDGK